MLGWVRDKYCRLSIVLLNKMTLSNEGKSNSDKWVKVAIGEVMSLAPLILDVFRRSTHTSLD